MAMTEAIATGVHLVEAAEIDKARGYFMGMLEAPAEAAGSHLWLARLDLAASDFESAQEHIQAAMAAGPESPEVLAVRGLAHALREEYAEALPDLEASAAADPALAMNYPNLSLCYRMLGRIPEAVEAGRKGVELAPNNAAAHYAYARALGGQRDFDGAIAHALKTIALNPLHLDALWYAGRLLEAAGLLDALIRLFEEGVKVNPQAIELREKLLKAHLSRKDYVGALKQAVAIANQRGATDDCVTAAECALRVNNKPFAEWYFFYAIARDPNAWQPHYGLGLMYLNNGVYDSALRELGAAGALNPGFWELQNQLGLCYLGSGRAAEAEAPFRAAMQAAPHRAEPVLNLAKSLSAAGRDGEARALARQVAASTEAGSFFHEEAQKLLMMLGQESDRTQ